MEQWATIPSFPNYEASSLGRIRRAKPGKRTRIGTILKPQPSKASCRTYLCVQLFHGGNCSKRGIHRLVCEAFNGPQPQNKPHCAHRDGNTENNIPTNLYWASARENCADKKAHGTSQNGSRNYFARLTERDIPAIRQAIAAGERSSAIAERYGVGRSNIRRIATGKNWRHVI